ncbi:MAG: pyridoxamine 5'-phosphate oxidase family protein [Actinomycetes bacterium]
MAEAPRAEQMDLPAEYGKPTILLVSETVEPRLEQALHYWLATVRPDGRPHTVPLDGIWLAGRWYFGGSPLAVKHRNLAVNQHATLHLEDAAAAVIVDGVCQWVTPDEHTAERLSTASKVKYGFGPPADAYREGVWRLRPSQVVAWTDLTRDATRFVFS